MADEEEQTKESSEEEDGSSEEQEGSGPEAEGQGSGKGDEDSEEEGSDEKEDSDEDEGSGEEEDSDEESSGEDEGSDEEEEKDAEDILVDQLIELHALEMQSIKQLEGALELVDDDELEKFYQERLDQTQDHEQKVRDRIEARDTTSSPIKDLQQQQSAGIGLRYLNQDPSDKLVKLAMHQYALDSLKIATYECLMRIAKEAGDDETSDMAESALEEDKQALEDLTGTFDKLVELLADGSGESGDSDGSDAEGSEDSGGEDSGGEEESRGSGEEDDEDEEDSEGSE